MRWFVRGDIDGFFGLAVDNLVQLLLIDSLCRHVLGFGAELLYGHVLARLLRISQGIEDAKAQGGFAGTMKRYALTAGAALTFGRMYLLPSKPNPLPEQMRLAPVW